MSKFVDKKLLRFCRLDCIIITQHDRRKITSGVYTMNTLETALIWPVIFIVFTAGLILGIRTAQVSFKQIEHYGEENSSFSPADVRRIVEVVYETIDDI